MSQARAILRNLHALNERRYVGDTNASDTLVDFGRAVIAAKLTARQTEALRLVYGEDLTQKVAGERMSVIKQAVNLYVMTAENKIDAVYDKWALKDEGMAT